MPDASPPAPRPSHRSIGRFPAAACHGRVTFADRPPAGTDPWTWWYAEFAADVLLYNGNPGDGSHAVTRWTDEGVYVLLDYRLTESQRSTALAHEMHHLAIGGVCSPLCPRNETKVRRATARWLIPDAVGLAARLRNCALSRVARDLHVGHREVLDRLQFTTPAEKAAIDGVMLQPPNWHPDARAARPTLASTA